MNNELLNALSQTIDTMRGTADLLENNSALHMLNKRFHEENKGYDVAIKGMNVISDTNKSAIRCLLKNVELIRIIQTKIETELKQ